MALLDSCRLELRIRTDVLDSDILLHIFAAKQELKRVGVPAEIVEDEMNDLVTRAIRSYVHSHMGPEEFAEQYMESFRLQADNLRKSILEVPGV